MPMLAMTKTSGPRENARRRPTRSLASRSLFGGSGGGGVGVAGPVAGGTAAFLLLVAGVGAVIWKRKRLCPARRTAAGVAAQSEA